MNTIWQKFITKHNGSFLARDSFENLCFNILDKHYPGREIVSLHELDKSSTDNLNVIFLSKFFFDELSNSRKGQIRKAFKKFIDYNNKNSIKVYAWVFCVPYILNDEEMKWWLTWKNKTSQKYSINIQFFDGDYCLQLSKKYDLFEIWFLEEETEHIQNEDIDKHESDNLFEFVSESSKLEDDVDLDANIKAKVDKENKVENKDETKQFLFAEKISYKAKYDYFKKEYIRVLEEAKTLSKEEIEKIKKENSQEKPFDFFNETSVETINTLKLFYKAKSFEVRKQYIQALFLFETIIERKDYLNILKFKKSEIPEFIKFCQEKTEAFINELEGDIHAIKKESKKAYLCYEKAFKKDKGNKTISRKYHLFLADKLTEQENYSDALINYQKVLRINNKDSNTVEKKKYAYWLGKGNEFFTFPLFKILNIFFNPIALWQAHSIFPSEKINKNLKTSLKKSFVAFSLLGIFVISIFVLLKIGTINKMIQTIPKTSPEVIIIPKKALNIDDIELLKGDMYMKKLSIANIYILDSAINEYKRAFDFDRQNEVAYNKLSHAQKLKNDYIRTAQIRILSQKNKYFISMRRVSEGLQLFKYVYNQDNKKLGKYGFVDTMMNIVIPPVYDFDYNKMYKGTENFNNNVALVCLRHLNNDTTFYNINKKNKIVKIYQ